MRDGGDFTVFDESAGRRALLRVPRPLRDLLLNLRKARRPTDSLALWVGWSGDSRSLQALRRSDRGMRPGFGV